MARNRTDADEMQRDIWELEQVLDELDGVGRADAETLLASLKSKLAVARLEEIKAKYGK